MISVRQALMRLSHVQPTLSIEHVALEAAIGRTLAEPIVAPIAAPPFSRAAMDGYAVLSSDTQAAPLRLALRGRIAAGTTGPRLSANSAVRILTGAPLPEGADAVIEQEAVNVCDDHIHLARAVAAGRNVMVRGHQYHRGQWVYGPGERLSSTHVGTLAGLGVRQVPVWRPLKVALVQTGDELVRAGVPLTGGAIYEVQAIWLPSLIHDWGGVVTEVVRVGDDLSRIEQAVVDASAAADLVLTSGGISVGDYDYVGRALNAVTDPLFWRVAMHPGRAVGAGMRGHTLIFALSGNPAAALTSWSVLVAPWWALVQHGRLFNRQERAPLIDPYPKPTREPRLLRVQRTAAGLDWHGPHSADVLSDPWNSGYALIEQGSPAVAANTSLTFWQPAGVGGTRPAWEHHPNPGTFDLPSELQGDVPE
jgi:molybdopterin molybdotransferase